MTSPAFRLPRITAVRQLRARTEVAAAVVNVRTAARDLADAEQALARSRAAHDRHDRAFREEPACEQRRFMLAASASRLQVAEQARREARNCLSHAQEQLKAARRAEERADQRHSLVQQRAAAARRRAAERQSEREGEDRWTPAASA